MITSPDNHGVTMIGCALYDSNSDDYALPIFKMNSNLNGTYTWTKMKQTMKFRRWTPPVIEYIHDDLVNCY